MKIMIDLDNVLFKCNSIPYILGNKLFTMTTFKKPLRYKTIDKEVAKNYKNLLFFFKFCNKKHLKELENSVSIINNWYNQGHEIHFVSSRPNLKSIQKETVDWLEEQKVNYDSLIFSCTNKPRFCQRNNFDIIIDDSLSNCIYSSTLNINAIWLTPKNKFGLYKYIPLYKMHYAINWNQVDSFVQEIYNKSLVNLDENYELLQ